MSVELRVTHATAVPAAEVWQTLVDWAGQGRWIPMTTVRVLGDRASGIGVRCEALSGFWLGRLPIGLLDRFTVTAWRPPTDEQVGILEVLHTGPWFRGPGSFEVSVSDDGRGSAIACSEIFDVVGGALPTRVAGWFLPVMRLMFATSLRRLAHVSHAGR